MKFLYSVLLFCSIATIFSPNLSAQSRRAGALAAYEDVINEKKQSEILSYISDDCARGRATGSLQGQLIASFIKRLFVSYGLEPYGEFYYQPFQCGKYRARNVVGVIKSRVPSNEWVVISAHYDHIGALNGFVYNGADDNASGVTAMLNLAEMFSVMNKTKQGPTINLLFVAFDAKEQSMAGSRFFVDNLSIPKQNIICNINLDQIGTVIEPVHEGREDYIIVLGEDTLSPKHRGKLGSCNKFYGINLDIDYTFYGSEDFTQMCYNMSDQVAFKEANIPALAFTSGFHKHSYKITDDENLISYPILKKRTLLAFYFINML